MYVDWQQNLKEKVRLMEMQKVVHSEKVQKLQAANLIKIGEFTNLGNEKYL